LKRSIFAAALAGFALVSLPFGAQGQMGTLVKPVQFGIAAGAALPTSDLSNDVSTGYNVTGTIAVHPELIPLGLRLDGAYNRFSFKNGIDGSVHFTSVTGNLVYKIPSEAVSPYLIGGAGWYNVGGTINGFGSGSENHFGWNLGGGISMPLSGFDTFIEARYNQVQGNGSSVKFIPITFGVMF
jgi:opacity protein-like surface antigen